MSSSAIVSYEQLGCPTEPGNYEFRERLYRVSECMINLAAEKCECAWQFQPYTLASKIVFYEAVRPCEIMALSLI
jgi:hypothetical protein